MADESRDRSVSQVRRVVEAATRAALLHDPRARILRTASCEWRGRVPGTPGSQSARPSTRLRQAEHANDIEQTFFLFLSGASYSAV